MSKDLIIRKPIINLEAALTFAEAKTAQEAHGAVNAKSEAGKASGTDNLASCFPVGDSRSTIDFDAALAFAEAKTAQNTNVAQPSEFSAGNPHQTQSARMGYKRLTIDIDQWLNKQLSLIAIDQKTTVDKIIDDLVRKYLTKKGFGLDSRGIKIRARDS